MVIGALSQNIPDEPRVPLLPESVKRLSGTGARVCVETGLAEHLFINNDAYVSAGAEILSREHVITASDILLGVRVPRMADIPSFRPGTVHISFADPFREGEAIKIMAQHEVTVISMDMIPRTTIAQKMDALSSQASLAGYYAVILASERIGKVLPMMTTPAGTIQPARVLVIGAGVAGLQAIATAKRLGARVDAFDTRPAVEEQVKSLGAKFIHIDLGETSQTTDGYARPLTPAQLEIQRQELAKVCAQADIVITTAQVFGRKAPLILTGAMVDGMRPGSVVVDLAVESGGNVDGIDPGKEIRRGGVALIGLRNLPGHVALDASRMYTNNVANLLLAFWDQDARKMMIDLDNAILSACVAAHAGRIRVPLLAEKHPAEADKG